MSVNSFNNGVAVRKSIARGAAATGDRSVKIVRGLTDFMRGVFAREPAAPTAKELAAAKAKAAKAAATAKAKAAAAKPAVRRTRVAKA